MAPNFDKLFQRFIVFFLRESSSDVSVGKDERRHRNRLIQMCRLACVLVLSFSISLSALNGRQGRVNMVSSSTSNYTSFLWAGSLWTGSLEKMKIEWMVTKRESIRACDRQRWRQTAHPHSDHYSCCHTRTRSTQPQPLPLSLSGYRSVDSYPAVFLLPHLWSVSI